MAIDKDAARAHLSACGVDFAADFHALPSDHVQALVDYAKAQGYRKPRNANGSTGRYFFAMLTRQSKYVEIFVVQSDYGYGHGWEDTTEHKARKPARAERDLYRKEQPEFSHRLITRRVLRSA